MFYKLVRAEKAITPLSTSDRNSRAGYPCPIIFRALQKVHNLMFHALFMVQYSMRTPFLQVLRASKTQNGRLIQRGYLIFPLKSRAMDSERTCFSCRNSPPFCRRFSFPPAYWGTAPRQVYGKVPFPFYLVFEESFYNWESTRRSPLLRPR